jgi:cell wall-associated NlpC family hydrolase
MRFLLSSLLIIPLLLQGCASTRSNNSGNQEYLRDNITHTALKQVGKPYKYGGSSPSSGFDCSGLVYYSHKKAGVSVPRDTRGQIARMTDVRRSQLQPGDLLFYKIEGNPRHVGIYIGNSKFVHAPSSGKRVKVESMNADYWRSRLYATGSYISH